MIISGSLLCSSCADWLEVLPKNEQVTADFWKTKEEVESILSAAYASLRSFTPTLVAWGELRGGSILAYSDSKRQKLQNFQLTASDDLCKWGTLYSTLNLANSVIKYAPEVQAADETYTEVNMKAHLTEAYFLRALCYFYLVRNYREVPLVLEPYIDDSAPFSIAKSPEADIIAQIKADLRTTIDTGAAKEFYEDSVEGWSATKGRATKWALYALMADVCLWSEDYDGCIEYADLLINATSARRPVFISDPEQWFAIFNPGNSNESIFEINWDQKNFSTSDNSSSPSNYFSISTTATFLYTQRMCEELENEANANAADAEASVRAEWGAYANLGEAGSDTREYCIWKYMGTEYQDANQQRQYKDANFIVYRMTEVWLMKAEALIWKGAENYQAAMDIINKVRTRARLANSTVSATDASEQEMLEAVLHERNIEFAAEGKRWYDLLRFARSKNYRYKDQLVSILSEYNTTANNSWITSVLADPNAWYLPISESELNVNPLLVQNPYYLSTNN